MGGALAGVFAAEYPHLVDRVTLMCPASKYSVIGYIKVLQVKLGLKIPFVTYFNSILMYAGICL